ncbi:MAG: hypothetical protein ACM31C_12950 [Acidobacteriota bacterium]
MTDTTEWTLLFQAFSDALEWALDRAADLSRGYAEEVATVERVRTFARRRIAGQPAHVRIEDLLFAFALVAGAVERELGERRAATVPMTGVLRERKAAVRRSPARATDAAARSPR